MTFDDGMAVIIIGAMGLAGYAATVEHQHHQAQLLAIKHEEQRQDAITTERQTFVPVRMNDGRLVYVPPLEYFTCGTKGHAPCAKNTN